MTHIEEQIAALKAEAGITPNGRAQWAADILAEAGGLVSGRALMAIGVECICIVFASERSDTFAENAWPVNAPALALRSSVLNSTDPVAEMETKMARLRRAHTYNDWPETNQMIRDIMESAKAKYPMLGLSFGYIGNCSLFGGKGYDDRSFRIFTTLRDKSNYSVSFGGHATDRQGDLLVEVETSLDSWCELQAKRLDAGEVYKVGNAAAA